MWNKSICLTSRKTTLLIVVILLSTLVLASVWPTTVKELNEDTGFKVSIKTLLGIGAAMATVISMWFMLQADIEEARQ